MAKVSVGLNPCCNGQWSRTILTTNIQIFQEVLILVVMDNGLVLDLIRLY